MFGMRPMTSPTNARVACAEPSADAVVAGGDEVDLGVRCEDPEAVFTSVGEEVCALGGIPHSDGLVLAVTVEEFRIERL